MSSKGKHSRKDTFVWGTGHLKEDDPAKIKLLKKSVSDIFKYLPNSALNELVSGYEGDLDRLMLETLATASKIITLDQVERLPHNFDFLSSFNEYFDEVMRRSSYNYFKTMCLPEFDQGWRNIEWGNLIQLYPLLGVLASRTSGKSYEFSFAYPLWKMYRYRKPKWGEPNVRENKLNKEGVIMTNEFSLGKVLMEKIREEIVNNDIIASVLRPDRITDLGKESISTRNGAKVSLRSFGSSIRGRHPGWIVVDDFLSVSSLYSSSQRDKIIEIFNAEIRPALEPGGDLKVVGTPFVVADNDIYIYLKKDPRFLVLEYPAVFPDGRLLAPDRLTFEGLKREKKSLSQLIFSREYLVKPISDSATIFPYDILNKSKNIEFKLTDNVSTYGKHFDRIAMGCDFAISGAIGADNTVFTIWGAVYGELDRYYLIGVWKKKGANHSEQVAKIIQMNNNFEVHNIVAENNGFQSIIVDMVEQRGVTNIEPFTTTSSVKKDLYSGLPSLAVLFERGQIVLPYGDMRSVETTDWLLGEFNSITFLEDKGKLESASQHDDGVMSSFFALTDLRENKGNFKVNFL